MATAWHAEELSIFLNDMSEKNVLIIQRYFYNFREGLFDCLDDLGLDFVLINSTTSRGRVKVHSDKVNAVDYIERCARFNINDGIVVFPFLFFKLIRMKPSVIVTEGGQNTINNIQVLWYSRLFGVPYIQWDLGKGYQDFGDSLARRLYMSVYKSIARKASLIYGYNSGSKHYFESLGIPSEKIVVLNNTADTRTLKKVIAGSSAQMPDDLAAIYNPDKKYVIFVGTLLPTKRIEDLADIMSRLNDGFVLLIVGSGNPDYTKQLQRHFKNVDCFFLGYKKPEELLPYYKVSSFCILPGLGGLSINQAMAYGVPVLCTHADGAEGDVVRNGETGYIYKDIDDAVRFIRSRNEEDWKRMGRNAQELMYGEFSMEKECERFIEGINRITDGSGQ